MVEQRTGQPVPFATVELLRLQAGAQGNAAGAFRLVLPAASDPTDSLVVSALGYGPGRVAVPAAGPLRVQLVALPVALGAVVVRPGPVVVVGPIGRSHRLGYACSGPGASSRGYQLARFFAPGAAGYLQQVAFLLGNGLIQTLGTPCDGKALSQAPFRVRLYAADGPGGAPTPTYSPKPCSLLPAGKGGTPSI
ncbi:hypothetical protein [Hymenobacter coccineus]|uniref:Uncharacterized protein n=1 Tax=Hymenobacter coccineus TaxID=1908235 RepID=A0A1G1TJK5_9BACT|nr:hypothetical protein [Hymenobacter coccineus]OGX91055.1 hypothetical protein BEN49_21180 [Hymenobacter coccineus]